MTPNQHSVKEMKMTYEIREAREDDRKQVTSLLTREFKAIGSFEEEWLEYYTNYWNKPEYGEYAFVALAGSDVIGDLAFHVNDCMNVIRGKAIRFAGVCAVATDARHRRKGALRGMQEAAFQKMNEMGIVAAILDPSAYQGAQIAYERLGYAPAEDRIKIDFLPGMLRETVAAGKVTSSLVEDSDESKEISEIEKSMGRYGSRVFTWPLFFANMIESGGFYILESGGQPVACARIVVDNERKAKVTNTYFTDEKDLTSIINLVVAETSDCDYVSWTIDGGIPLRHYVSNVKKVKIENAGSMMLRIVNFAGYCNAIEFRNDVEAALSIRVKDPECPWNEGDYALELSDGTLLLESLGRASKPEVTLTPFQLSLLAGGLYSPMQLQKYGIIPCTSETASKIECIFPADSFVSYPRW